jgi:hypothetical protein
MDASSRLSVVSYNIDASAGLEGIGQRHDHLSNDLAKLIQTQARACSSKYRH